MKDARKVRSAEFSRRSLLRNVAYVAGGAAMLGTTVSGNRVAEAQAKMSQKAIGYQDTPKGAQRCDNCAHWLPPASCKLVEGTIAAAGWCRIYLKKPAGQ